MQEILKGTDTATDSLSAAECRAERRYKALVAQWEQQRRKLQRQVESARADHALVALAQLRGLHRPKRWQVYRECGVEAPGDAR